MNARGQRIIVFGDSLSHHGADNAPEVWDVNAGSGRATGAPGDLLASLLAEQGAEAVRVNARVGRSAWNFWGREMANTLLAGDAAFHPTKVVVVLGTNDVGLNATLDRESFVKIRDAYKAMGAEVWAIGPFANTKLDAQGVQTVVNTMSDVFSGRFIDGRQISQLIHPGGDGVHYAQASARQLALAMADALLSKFSPTTLWSSIAIGAVGVGGALLLGLAWKRHKQGKALLGKPSRDPSDDQWDVAMDAILEHDPKRAAKIWHQLRAEHGVVTAPPEFLKALHEVPADVRWKFEEYAAADPEKLARLGLLGKPSRDSIDELIADPDPAALDIAEDAMLERGDKLTQIARVSGKAHTFSNFELSLGNNDKLMWRVTEQGMGRCVAQFIPIVDGEQVDDPNGFHKDGQKIDWAAAFPEGYYGGADYCERSAAATAWKLARTFKSMSGITAFGLSRAAAIRYAMESEPDRAPPDELFGLEGSNIVDGKRYTGDEASLVRDGARKVPCASGLDKKSLATCWTKKPTGKQVVKALIDNAPIGGLDGVKLVKVDQLPGIDLPGYIATHGGRTYKIFKGYNKKWIATTDEHGTVGEAKTLKEIEDAIERGPIEHDPSFTPAERATPVRMTVLDHYDLDERGAVIHRKLPPLKDANLGEIKIGDAFKRKGSKAIWTVAEIVKPARTIGTLRIGETVRVTNGSESVEITNAQGAWIDGTGKRWGLGEYLPGGKASGRAPREFDQAQLKIGTRVELEHTPDKRIAREIAMDHLAEDPAYYQKLRTIHLDGARRRPESETRTSDDHPGMRPPSYGKLHIGRKSDDYKDLPWKRVVTEAKKERTKNPDGGANLRLSMRVGHAPDGHTPYTYVDWDPLDEKGAIAFAQKLIDDGGAMYSDVVASAERPYGGGDRNPPKGRWTLASFESDKADLSGLGAISVAQKKVAKSVSTDAKRAVKVLEGNLDQARASMRKLRDSAQNAKEILETKVHAALNANAWDGDNENDDDVEDLRGNIEELAALPSIDEISDAAEILDDVSFGGYHDRIKNVDDEL